MKENAVCHVHEYRILNTIRCVRDSLPQRVVLFNATTTTKIRKIKNGADNVFTINCWFSCKRDIDELANNNKMKKAKSCVAVVTHQSSQYFFFFLHRNFYVF